MDWGLLAQFIGVQRNMTQGLPHAGTAESRHAAALAELSNIEQARRLYNWVASRPDGGTGPEAEAHFSEELWVHNVTPRMRALKFSGFLVRHPQRISRPTVRGGRAAVYVAAPEVNWESYQEAFRDVPLSRLEPAALRLVESWRAYQAGNGDDREAALFALLRLYGVDPNQLRLYSDNDINDL